MRRVLIADDHEVTRRGIRDILLDHFPDLKVVEAADADSAYSHLSSRDFDLLILDLLMPGEPVLKNIARIRSQFPRLPILILTAATETEYIVETMRAGANGLIHKHRASSELIEAVGRVCSGGSYLHPESAVAVAATLREGKEEALHDRLSERELEVFRLIAVGFSIKEIALQVSLSEKTVATYLARIREKTGLNSHVDIARYALHRGLVD